MVSSLVKAARKVAKEAKDVRKQTKEALQKPKEKPVDVSQGTGQQEFTKTRKAYKLFVQRDDGGLYPLFVDADTRIPEKVFTEANFPKEAFTAPNGRLYVPSKGAKREARTEYYDPDGKKITKAQYDELGSNAKKQSKKVVLKGEKKQATGESIIIPDEKTRKLLIEKGYITDRVKRTEEAPFGRVTAVAARPGYHASQKPVATHIGPQDIKITSAEAKKLLKAGITPEAIKKRKGQLYVKRRAEDQVFAEVEMADDVNYEDMLLKEGKTDINDRVPVGGSYRYVDGQADSDFWVVGGNMKVNRVLSRDEVKTIQQQEGVKDLPYKQEVENILGKKFSKGGLLEGDSMQEGIDDYVVAKTEPETETIGMNVGGTPKKSLESQQLEMFGDIGMAKSPAKRDPVSGNEIPKASTAEEVRDDIPAQLSEGEFVLPADVVRYHGLEKLMNLRQEAKQGINTMDKMGQLGNSDEATIPDDLPFDVNDIEMAEGGFVNTGTYQVPTNIYQQPSFLQSYQQTTAPFKPFVQPVQQTPVQQIQQKRQTGPSFATLMPTIGGTRTTKEYRNEAGQKLFIPFIDGNPIYPVPEGYTEYKPTEVSEDTTSTVTNQVQPKTSRVIDSGADTDTMVRSTRVTGLGAGKPLDTNFETQSPDQVKRNLDQMKQGDRGLSVLAALEKSKGSTGLSKAIQQAGAVLPSLMAPGAMAIPMLGAQLYKAGTFNPIEAFKEIGNPDPTSLNNILSGYGYNTTDFGITDDPAFEGDTMAVDARNEALSQAMYGKSLAEITQELGVAPSFKRGKKPGDIDIETGNTFDEDGQAGGAYEVPTYASFSDFTKAMGISAKTGFMGSKATAKDVMSRNPVTSKAYQRAQSFLNAFKEDKEDKKPEVKSPIVKDTKPTGQEFLDRRNKKIAEEQRKAGIERARQEQAAKEKAEREARAKRNYQALLDRQRREEGSGDSGDGSQSAQDQAAVADQQGGLFTAVGGFIKKPKPKVKKMKRGGLASR